MSARWSENTIINGKEYSLLKIKKKSGEVQLIAVDRNSILGRGGYAVVHPGYYLLETGGRDTKKPLAVRIEDLSRAENVGKKFEEREQEAEEQRKMIPTDIYRVGNDAVSVMPDLGKPISALIKELKHLTLSQRFELAALVIQACAEFHARRYYWVDGKRVLRDGLSHTDLKPQNFLIKIEYHENDKEHKHPKFTCTLIDFTTRGVRTPVVTAPECMHGEKIEIPVDHALEMETYAMVSLLAPIFGEDDLYANQENTWEVGSQFKLDRIIKALKKAGKELGLAAEMEEAIDTIESMRDSNPAKRPSDLAIIKVLNRAKIACLSAERKLPEESVDEEDTKKLNKIFAAIKVGKLDIVKTEIAADLRRLLAEVNPDGLTPLGIAVQHGQYKIAAYLLKKFSNAKQKTAAVEQTDWNGRPLLHLAVLGNHADLVELLLKEGADANRIDADGRTPLHCALAMRCDVALVKKLVAKGADVQEKNNHGRTSLEAAIANACDLSVVKYLTEITKDKNPKELFILAVKSGSKKVVQHFCTAEFVKIKYRYSPLHFAVRAGHVAVAEFLIQYGFDVKETDNTGNTLLHLAAMRGQLEMAALLLKNKNIDRVCKNNKEKIFHEIQDRRGNTLLHLAIIKGDVSLVKLLIKDGAKIHIQNEDGRTPLHFAILSGRSELVELCYQQPNVKEAFNTKDVVGCTPLHYLAQKVGKIKSPQHGRLQVELSQLERFQLMLLQRLIETGADLNIMNSQGKKFYECYKYSNGGTLLHLAIFHGNVELAKSLIKAGADINVRNTDNLRPLEIKHKGSYLLHLAVMKGDQELTALLLKKGAQVREIDEKGNTPLHYAVKRDNINLVRFLIYNGASETCNTKNKDGKTPLNVAQKSKEAGIKNLLFATQAPPLGRNQSRFFSGATTQCRSAETMLSYRKLVPK